jgi:tRNA threonylcarbamoyladenosine biosynthesis protein TsaE
VRLRPGDVVAVSGELGSGKTTFVRGACRALGVTGPVTSPTYTIGHRYEGSVPVAHLDLYRFERVSEADWGALEPYFDDAVVFVEWPEAAGAALPAPRLRVRLGHVGETRRLIVLEGDADLGI